MSDVTDKLISAAELIAYASRFSVWDGQQKITRNFFTAFNGALIQRRLWQTI